MSERSSSHLFCTVSITSPPCMIQNSATGGTFTTHNSIQKKNADGSTNTDHLPHTCGNAHFSQSDLGATCNLTPQLIRPGTADPDGLCDLTVVLCRRWASPFSLIRQNSLRRGCRRYDYEQKTTVVLISNALPNCGFVEDFLGLKSIFSQGPCRHGFSGFSQFIPFNKT